MEVFAKDRFVYQEEEEEEFLSGCGCFKCKCFHPISIIIVAIKTRIKRPETREERCKKGCI